MKCSRTGCPRAATRTPVLSFASEPNGVRAYGRLNLPICATHAQPDPKLFVTDEGWSQICNAMKDGGLQTPDRSTLQVEFSVIV